jgi:integrase
MISMARVRRLRTQAKADSSRHIALGAPISLKAERVRFDGLLDDLLTEYRVNQRASLPRMEQLVGHLRGYFLGAKAMSVDTATVRSYIDARQQAKAANATINRELAALKRAYSLAVKATPPKVTAKPHIPSLAENNVRQEFFEPDQLEAVRRHLPEEIQPVATFGYVTGWRLTEVLSLTWKQVSFDAATVRLEPGTTKNKEGRLFPFTPELRALLEAQKSHTADLQARTGRIIPWVFHRKGKAIKSFYGAWRTACTAAGVPGRLFHDFDGRREEPRTPASRSAAMKMTGHKTEAVYRRYAIVNEADLHEAAAKLGAAVPRRMGTITGTVAGGGVIDLPRVSQK